MDLHITSKQRVLHICLNRREKRNALTSAMCTDIVNTVSNAQEKDDVGCIMISAAGSVFCSGMDLDEVLQMADPDLSAIHEPLFTMGSQSVKPIVVAVNGPALGGGLGLVAQGHLVFASENALFGLPEIRVGLWPFLVYRSIEASLGPRRALELSLTGHSFNAAQAYDWGLIHQVCPCTEIVDRAKAMARELAKASPLALSTGMHYIRQAAGKSWKESGELAAPLRANLMRGADFREGFLAFKQKREPRWPSMPSDFYTNGVEKSR